MNRTYNPHIDSWFKNEAGDSFKVVAWDVEDDYIEVQHYDGTVEELDADSWQEQNIVAIEPPEDWSGSYDIEREDYGVDLEGNSGSARGNPLDNFDQ